MRLCRTTVSRAALGAYLAFAAPLVFAALTAPVAPIRPVIDRYFGVDVTDPYRWMETGGTELLDYMKGQDAVTRQALAPFAAENDRILARLAELAHALPVTRSPQRVGDTYFYLQIPPDRGDLILMTRAVHGGSERALLDPARFANAGSHAAIDYFVPSWDGRYVVVGVSPGGSEDSTIHVLETSSGRLLPDAITRAQEGRPSRDEDNRGFHYSRLQAMAANAPAATKYENMRVYHHLLGRDPESDSAVFGADVVSNPALPKIGDVGIEHLRGTRLLLASQVTGVVETPAIWRRARGAQPWQMIVRHEDGVLHMATHGRSLYVISKTGAANGRVLRFDAATQTLAEARVILPESELVLSSRNNSGLVAARDALYVLGIRDGLAVLLRLPYADHGAPTELRLPVQGAAQGLTADDRREGFTLGLSGWTVPPRFYRYDPRRRSFADTGLQAPNPADFGAIASDEVEATSIDGTRVPLSIVHRRDAPRDGSNPTLLEAYGAYGIALTPSYNAALLPWLERGGIIAVAHVRGGGEKGEAWHVAGMKETKQHTVDDFVACARYLIEQGYTSSEHLGIEGTSAGGIAVGGFLTQHPDLVHAVLYRVGITDVLRSEQRATGTANSSEYGSVKVASEFRAMYAVSPYAHVVDGTAYPAVMLETGANDPRVTSWMLTKMTARLQQANASQNPILLRVDFDAGHGLGSDRNQALQLKADEYTFLGWRLGLKGFAPAVVAP